MKIYALFLSFALGLSGCTTYQGMFAYDKSFKLDDGRKMSLPLTRGGALPTENEHYKMTVAGTMTQLSKDGLEKSELIWMFSFRSKSKLHVKSVTVEQVNAAGELIPILQDNAPILNTGRWDGKSPP